MQVGNFRFAADLAALTGPDDRIGIAFSGGPDSLALLLLASAARPGRIEAATVDHRLRPESRAEAKACAQVCATLAVPHTILTARWAAPPTANLQANARAERYALLGEWATTRRLSAVATAHHADDQAETLLMRLARGSGIAGLGGARASRPLVEGVALVRPLLARRKVELEAVVAAAGLVALDDPSNRDARHDRARMRAWLADAAWADPERLAASASHLRDADDALDWAVRTLAETRVARDGDVVTIDPAGLPRELQRRLLLNAFAEFDASPPRGPDLVSAMTSLHEGTSCTLAGLKLEAGPTWRLTRAPPRSRRA